MKRPNEPERLVGSQDAKRRKGGRKTAEWLLEKLADGQGLDLEVKLAL